MVDSDAVFQKVLSAGAVEMYPLANQFYGGSSWLNLGPIWGHYWIITTKICEVLEPEMMTAFQIHVSYTPNQDI